MWISPCHGPHTKGCDQGQQKLILKWLLPLKTSTNVELLHITILSLEHLSQSLAPQTCFGFTYEHVVMIKMKPLSHIHTHAIPNFFMGLFQSILYIFFKTHITLFIFITNFCRTDNIPHNILKYSHIQFDCGKYYVEYCQSHRTLL